MSDAMLALGAALQTAGRGWMDYNQQNEERRRWAEVQAARQAEADEMRAFRAQQAEFQRTQQREQRRSQRRAELQNYWARQRVVLDPDKLNALIDIEEQADEANVGPMVTEGPIGVGTLPGGMDPFAAAPAAPAPRPVDAMSEIVRRGLKLSRAQHGAPVSLDEGWGFAQDEAAYNAYVRAQQQAEADAREAEMRKSLAAIARGSGQGGGLNVSRLNSMINDQEQRLTAAQRTVPTRMGDAAIAAQIPTERQTPRFAQANAAFVADSTRAMNMVAAEQARLDALRVLRGDSELMEEGGATPLVVQPSSGTAAPSQPSMNPEQMRSMTGELTALSNEVASILNDPRATAQEKAEARALLQEGQTRIVKRYQAQRRPAGRPVASAEPARRSGVTAIGTATQPPEVAAATPFQPGRANPLQREDAEADYAPAGTLDAMIAMATGATPRRGRA